MNENGGRDGSITVDEHIEALLHEFGSDDAVITAIRDYAKPRQIAPEPDTPVIISVDHLTKTYTLHRQKIEALRDVSLRIHKGEFVALTGASGGGKSTLLQLIGGLDQPTSGTITIDDITINRLRDAQLSTFRNQTIGFVFQFFYLQPFLKLTANTEVPGMFRHSPRGTRKAHATELLKRVGLEEYATRLPKELSGGQIQRAAIARSLLNNPKIILADEPTGNLDSANSKEIIDLFESIRKEFGTTIVIVTHNPEIARHADREIHLRDGAIV